MTTIELVSAAYGLGYINGRETALNEIWGGAKPTFPDFDTCDEAWDYDEGFQHGYDSVE